jgi:hypothetical protein
MIFPYSFSSTFHSLFLYILLFSQNETNPIERWISRLPSATTTILDGNSAVEKVSGDLE